MKIAAIKETRPNETRVAISPESAKKLAALGFEICIEAGAGAQSDFSDDAYAEVGVTVAASAADALSGAEIVLKVQRPTEAELGLIQQGAYVAAIYSAYSDRETVDACARANVVALAMDFMPRITRAQSMDVLSSQSNLSGYKAVIDASAAYGRALPMMMTAAGTIAPAKVFVMGAGVAGLQAIATAKRLGAVVSATDVRPAVKEQVESLGGTFVMVESEEMESAETSGGYAKEMSEDFKKRQAELVSEHIKKQNIVICTALIPGRPAPELVSEAQVRSMGAGSVIVDLAVEQGGNCALSKPGEVVDADGVKILGHLNMAGRLASDASSLYARNLVNFLSPMADKEAGGLKVDWEDEIIKGVALTKDGAVIHPALTENAG